VILQETSQVDLKDNHATTDAHFIDPSQFLSDQIAEASPDLLRSMLSTFMQAMMGADADAQSNADYGQPPRAANPKLRGLGRTTGPS